MSRYFNYFPKTVYTSNNKTTGLDTVTNIIARFAFERTLKENSAAFYKYNIQETDTPEIIASKYYDNPERHWIILMFNEIIDAQWDWPLEGRNFIEFVNEKYAANAAANVIFKSGYDWAKSINNIHSYYKVISTTTSGIDGKVTIEKFRVDANTYANKVTITIHAQTFSHRYTHRYTFTHTQDEFNQEVISLSPAQRKALF
jgi:hypothetical protein